VGNVRVTFLGTGGPFASGGRLQSCVLVEGSGGRVLIDCGATALVGMDRYGVDPDSIDAILLSHLHGDHFGGIPFLVVEALAGSRARGERPRDRRLLIAGPPETEDRVRRAMDVFGYAPFHERAVAAGLLAFVALEPGRPTAVRPVEATAFSVVHTPEATALRVTCAGKTVGYSGDTEWTDALVEAAADADLFICLAYSFDTPLASMLSHATLAEQRARLTCRRLLLTHIGPEMQRRLADAAFEVAEDGMVVEL
jgi:ribonuclease BN (tRNA processing enzyme)